MTKAKKKGRARKSTKRSTKRVKSNVHIPESLPPLNLVAIGRRLANHYAETGIADYEHADVDVDLDFNEEECGPGTTDADVTEVGIKFDVVLLGDERYFDMSAFVEDLWFDVCNFMNWKGDASDRPFKLRNYGVTKRVLDYEPGVVTVAWSTSMSMLRIWLHWEPGSKAGRDHLKKLHNS